MPFFDTRHQPGKAPVWMSGLMGTLGISESYKERGGPLLNSAGLDTSSETSQVPKFGFTASSNLFDPVALPKGTTVTLTGADYRRTEFNAAFRELAAQTGATSAESVGFLISKTGDNTVSVIAGSTEALALFSTGDFRAAKNMLGRSPGTTSCASLKTAEFDLSSSEGNAAFNNLVRKGHLPTDNSYGVSNVATITKTDSSSDPKFDFTVGCADQSFKGGNFIGSVMTVTKPDRSATQMITVQFEGNVPWQIERTFDPNGQENVKARVYTATISVDIDACAWLSQSVTTPALPEQTKHVTVKFTWDQMEQLMRHAQYAFEARPANENMRMLVTDANRKIDDNVAAFAFRLQHQPGGNNRGLLGRFLVISQATQRAVCASVSGID